MRCRVCIVKWLAMALCLSALPALFAQPARQPAGQPAAAPAAVKPVQPDRRPVAVISFADNGFRSPANPRGWNPAFHKNLDAREADYPERFARAVEPFVAQSIDRAVRLDSQAMLWWDVEGQEFDHNTSYIGRPLPGFLPPEMKPEMIKRWVGRLFEQGIRSGFTIRDTRPVRGLYGGATQEQAVDVYRSFCMNFETVRKLYGIEKVTWAYWDTNSPPLDGGEGNCWPAETIAKVMWRSFGCTIITEHAGPGYGRIQGVASLRYWPNPARDNDRAAREVISFPPELRPTDAQREELVRSIRAGSLLLVSATWDTQSNDVALAAIKAAGQ